MIMMKVVDADVDVICIMATEMMLSNTGDYDFLFNYCVQEIIMI